MSHALLLPGEEEPPVPPWKPRMPTDPDIQKKKTAEELLWEAAFDGDHETAGPILEAGGLDLNWRAVPRLGFFMPTEPGHFGWTKQLAFGASVRIQQVCCRANDTAAAA